MKIKLHGPKNEIENLFAAIRSREIPDLEILQMPAQETDAFAKEVHGHSLWMYGLVVFTGHLAAALVHDYLKNLIAQRVPKNTIELEMDSLQDQKRTPNDDSTGPKT